MIIIIIIGVATAGFGTAIAVVVFLFFMMFSTGGDGHPGAINIVTRDRLCYPDSTAFNTSRAMAKRVRQSDANDKNARYEEIKKNLSIIWLRKGTKVKVTNAKFTVYDQPIDSLVRVEPLGGYVKPCFISGRFLEMEFGESVVFTWEKITRTLRL